MRGPLLLILTASLAASPQQARHSARPIAWDDAAPVRQTLEAAGLTQSSFAARIDAIRRTNARRVQEGDLDHLIFYLLQSTTFTKQPRLEPALSARMFVDTGEIPSAVRSRAAAFLRAVDSGRGDERLTYFRSLARATFADAAGREDALLREYTRVMKFLYEKEFVAQRSERRYAAVAELYRTRGLSTDTAIEAGFLVSEGLAVARGLDPDLRIRRVLIVGPGLDLAPRTGLLEAAAPESYQPWAVVDALLALGLSRLDDLAVVGADINPRVVGHLRRARGRARTLRFVSGVAEIGPVSFSEPFREYFAQLGSQLGARGRSEAGERSEPASAKRDRERSEREAHESLQPPRSADARRGSAGAPAQGKSGAPPALKNAARAGHLSKTVRVDASIARALDGDQLDIVTERLTTEPFDLVIATNLLPYFDDLELALALTNIAAMLAPGGLFLHNEARPVMEELTTSLKLRLEQSRTAVIAEVRGAPPLVDSVFVHRKARGPGGPGVRGPGGPGARGPGSGGSMVSVMTRGIIAVLVSSFALWLTAAGAPGATGDDPGFSFTNIAARAGLDARTVYGQQGTNTYLIETTGTGVAVLDYDGDGWMDIFVVNGTTLEFDPGPSMPAIGSRTPAFAQESPEALRRGKPDPGPRQRPTNHLYRNRRDGTFEDVTVRAGLAHSGWGQAACVGDYDNDGREDLFVTYWGQNRLHRNRGDGTFDDVTARAGLVEEKPRWTAGCAFLDYDRDGRLDLMSATYVELDLANTPAPSLGLCRYKGLPVACGPSGLPGGTNVLYRNRGDGTFADVSQASGIASAKGTYGLGVSTLDFNGDGWVDLYVANDSTASALYSNNRDGTFTDVGSSAGCAYNQDGRPQAGMGVAIGDYDRNGTMDLFKTNFAGDTSTLYANTGGACEDRTFPSGIGVNTRWLGWGVGFVDLDGDGWLDLFLVNGHVYPEVDRLKSEAGYKQPKVVYRNLRNGRFADVTERLGPPVTTPKAGRGAAFADFDNDGDVDVVVNNVHDTPDLFRLDRAARRHWITLKLVGSQSNRSAIGALARVVTSGGEQRQEVRGGGSYYSQNDLRLHFGLGEASRVERVVVRWPNGLEEAWISPAVDRAHTLMEETGTKQGTR